MQSLAPLPDLSYTPLGERRGNLDLAKFSLDTSWDRVAPDCTRSRAYPSPPMSGSPPQPPRHILDPSDRGHAGYGTGQDVFRGTHAPHSESADSSRRGLQPFHPEQNAAPVYPSHMDDHPTRYQYQQVARPPMAPQSQSYYTSHPTPQPLSQSYTLQPRPPTGEGSERDSPKVQRKTKGHVASACVPCKRAHLRCDAQRPCSRCLSNGKEDACVDVQHKKRGRPRLRDERDTRYESVGRGFQPRPEAMRRPLSLYGANEAPTPAHFGENSLQRAGSYRVLKSHAGASIPPPRFPEHVDAMYGAPPPPAPRMAPQMERMCAYLTMDLQITKATQAFGDAIGVQSVSARKLLDIVSPHDRDKVFRLQRTFEDERREREPNYLPPIYPKYEEDRVIQSVGFEADETANFQTARTEMFTFQSPDGQQRAFHVGFGLAKKDSTYFVVILLQVPATPQTYPQPSPSYPRESYSRESQYGYQTQQQQMFSQTSSNASPYPPPPSGYGDPRGEMLSYRPSGSIGIMASGVPQQSIPPYGQPHPRPEFSQGPNPYQTPRSEMSAQAQPPMQRDLQLPPIRDQRGEGHVRRDDRSGRVDIGGLLEDREPRR